MGIFGKILIVLNLLAMVGFTVLATLDAERRRDWAFAALNHEIRIVGLPVEPPNPLPTNLDPKEYAPFVFTGESGTFTELKLKILADMIPPGGEPFGSATVANQEDEVKRLEKVVFDIIETGSDKRGRLATFLLNLAETGEERDGAYALLNGVSISSRTALARPELAYLAPGPSQQSGLLALHAVTEYQRNLKAAKNNDDSGPLREAARSALIRLAVADLPYTVSIPSAGNRQARYDAQRKVTDERSKPALFELIQASLRLNVTDEDLRPLRTSVQNLSQDEAEKVKLLRIAQLAGNLLESDAKIADAIQQITNLILERCETDAERKALQELISIVDRSTPDSGVEAKAIQVGQALLRLKFALAVGPIVKPAVTTLTGKDMQTETDKRSRIAHLLYHIDADQDWSTRATWHRRVAAIVGINTYTDVVEAQASRILSASQRVDQLILNEQGVFEARYAALVREAQYLADLLTTVESELKSQTDVVEQYQIDVNQRQGERDTLATNLANSKANAKKSLTDFNVKQTELLEKTRKLREAQDSISRLEAEIRRLEADIKGKN